MRWGIDLIVRTSSKGRTWKSSNPPLAIRPVLCSLTRLPSATDRSGEGVETALSGVGVDQRRTIDSRPLVRRGGVR